MRFALIAYFGFFAFGCATAHDIPIYLVKVQYSEPKNGKIIIAQGPMQWNNEYKEFKAREHGIMSYVCAPDSYRITDEGIELPDGETAAYSLPRDKSEESWGGYARRRQYKNFVCETPLEFEKKSRAPLPEPPSPKKKN